MKKDLIALASENGAVVITMTGTFYPSSIRFTPAALEAFAAALSSATPAGEGLTWEDLNLEPSPLIEGWRVEYHEQGRNGPGVYAYYKDMHDGEDCHFLLSVPLAASPVPMSDTGAQIKQTITNTIGFDWEPGELQTVNADDLLRLAAALASPPPQSAPQEASKVEPVANEPAMVIAMDEGEREPRIVSWNKFATGTHWLYLRPTQQAGPVVLPPGWVAIPLEPTKEQWLIAQGTLLDVSWNAVTCLAARIQALIGITREQWAQAILAAAGGSEK